MADFKSGENLEKLLQLYQELGLESESSGYDPRRGPAKILDKPYKTSYPKGHDLVQDALGPEGIKGDSFTMKDAPERGFTQVADDLGKGKDLIPTSSSEVIPSSVDKKKWALTRQHQVVRQAQLNLFLLFLLHALKHLFLPD